MHETPYLYQALSQVFLLRNCLLPAIHKQFFSTTLASPCFLSAFEKSNIHLEASSKTLLRRMKTRFLESTYE